MITAGRINQGWNGKWGEESPRSHKKSNPRVPPLCRPFLPGPCPSLWWELFVGFCSFISLWLFFVVVVVPCSSITFCLVHSGSHDSWMFHTSLLWDNDLFLVLQRFVSCTFLLKCCLASILAGNRGWVTRILGRGKLSLQSSPRHRGSNMWMFCQIRYQATWLT